MTGAPSGDTDTPPGNVPQSGGRGPVAAEAVVTFDRLEGYLVVRRLGIARGEADAPRNRLREAFRDLGRFVGILPAATVDVAERARAACLAELRAHAGRLGANGVLSVRFTAEESPERTYVRAIGEAVVLEREPAERVESE